jgi:hypothetical protein
MAKKGILFDQGRQGVVEDHLGMVDDDDGLLS